MLTAKPTGKRLLGMPRHKREENIRLNIKEIGINARNLMIRLRIGIIGEYW